MNAGMDKKKNNNLFYVCSLIEEIARKTKNTRSDTVKQLGKETLSHIYDLADVYHCETLEAVAEEFISRKSLKTGTFDNVKECKYAVPSSFDIGQVYRRLISGIAKKENIDIIEALFKAYMSKASTLIDDYNGSFYYDNPQNILYTYYHGTEQDEYPPSLEEKRS